MIVRNIILSILILAVGIFGARKIILMKPQAILKPQSNLGVLVERQRFDRVDQAAMINGQGIVEPAERVNLIAQVSGVVTKLHTQFSVGARFNKGVKLVNIDPTDYSLAITEARARVKIAQQELSLESGRKKAAEKEWSLMQKRMGTEVSEAARDRALRVPQAMIAKNQVKIAKNALRRAQVNYGRTVLKAPFNAVVLSEGVDKGQLVGPGAPIAQLAGTDAFWITASVPTGELGWINFPQKKTRRSKAKKGSKAIVRYDVGAYVIEREGFVLRQLTQVETTGRMARVVIEVRDPLGIQSGDKPLLLGAQVEVHILGGMIENVIEVPRSSIHNENKVWVFKALTHIPSEISLKPESLNDRLELGTLEVKEVRVLRRKRDTVLIKAGITEFDSVITSRLPTPVPGMKLRALPLSSQRP